MAEPFEGGDFKPIHPLPHEAIHHADTNPPDFFPSIRPEFVEQKPPAKGKHSEQPDPGDGSKDADPSFLILSEIAGKSFVHTSVEDTANSVGQLVNHFADRPIVPDVRIFAAQEEAAVGTKRWYAQTIGGGAGALFPFLATELATRRIGGTELFAHVSGAADTIPVLRSIAGSTHASHWAAPWAKSVMDGGIYGTALTPVAEPENHFFQQRGINGLTTSICFGTQYGISHGLVSGLEKAGIGHAHFDAHAKLDLKTAAGHVASNLAGGIGAGTVGAESYSLLSEHRFADADFVEDAVAKFALTGVTLEAAHLTVNTVLARGDVGEHATGHASADADETIEHGAKEHETTEHSATEHSAIEPETTLHQTTEHDASTSPVEIGQHHDAALTKILGDNDQ